MNKRRELRNYIDLGVQATLVFLSVKYVVLTLHELGHCLGAWLVGLKPIGFYSGLLGGGGAFITGSGSFWQNLITTAAGPTLEFLFGIASFFLVLPRMKRWLPQVFWLYASLITIFSFWVYMTIGGILGYGDFAQLTAILGIGRYVAGIVGIAGLLGFALILGRRMYAVLSPYFLLDSFWNRFTVVFLFVGVPGIINTVGAYFLSPREGLSQLFLVSVIVLLICVLFSLLKQESALSLRDLPRWSSAAAVLSFAAVLLIWLGFFGPSFRQAKGVLWALPEEGRPAACNVSLTIEKDWSAHIDFLMRPYTSSLFWEKIKRQTPYWSVYTQFVNTSLPALLGITEYTIVDTANDLSVPFFCTSLEEGARRVSLVGSVEGKLQQRGKTDFALEITDFWRVKGGFLEKVNVVLKEGMRFSSYELTPGDARKPDHFSEREIFWQNRDARAPEKIRLVISLEAEGNPNELPRRSPDAG